MNSGSCGQTTTSCKCAISDYPFIHLNGRTKRVTYLAQEHNALRICAGQGTKVDPESSALTIQVMRLPS